MSHEQAPRNHESKNTLSPAEAKQHQERLKEHVESRAEKAGDSSKVEQEARHEVHETAQSAAEMVPTNSESSSQASPIPPTKQEKRKSFNTTMHHVRKNMGSAERTLSKVIHQPAIEKTSEVVGKTVARPSGIIGASIAAAIGLLLIFGIAKYAGFQLSGSEMPLLLAIGLVVGLISEWAYKSVRSLVSPGK